MAGAMTPMLSYVGSRPMRKVATPISISVMTRIFLRPISSPSRPKMMPPTGREM